LRAENLTEYVDVFDRISRYDGPSTHFMDTRMQRLSFLLTLLVLLADFSGCSNRSRSVIGGPDAEEAGIRMEESRQEYYDCEARIHPGAPSCDRLKALYEKDKAEYDAQVR